MLLLCELRVDLFHAGGRCECWIAEFIELGFDLRVGHARSHELLFSLLNLLWGPNVTSLRIRLVHVSTLGLQLKVVAVLRLANFERIEGISFEFRLAVEVHLV